MKDLTFFKVERNGTVVDAVAEKLIHYISVNELEEGDKLPSERELIQIIGVSRLAIREGLSMLKAIGLIEARHGKGIFVKRVNLNTIFALLSPLMEIQTNMNVANVTQARLCLEPFIANLAARHRSDKNLKTLKRSFNRMTEHIDDVDQFVEWDMKFHRVIASSTQNKLFLLFVHSLHDLLEHLNFAYPKSLGNRKISQEFHEKLYDAIESQDGETAERVMREHIESITRATD